MGHGVGFCFSTIRHGRATLSRRFPGSCCEGLSDSGHPEDRRRTLGSRAAPVASAVEGQGAYAMNQALEHSPDPSTRLIRNPTAPILTAQDGSSGIEARYEDETI